MGLYTQADGFYGEEADRGQPTLVNIIHQLTQITERTNAILSLEDLIP